MRALWQLVWIGVSLATVLPLRAAVEPLKHLPPGTAVVARLNLDALRRSALVTNYTAANPERIKGMYDLMRQQTGVDPEQIQQIWFFAQDGRQGMAAITGTFATAALREHLTQQPNMTAATLAGSAFAFSFVTPRDNQRRLCALVDEQLMLVGDETSLTAFLAGMQGTATTAAPTLSTAQQAQLTQSSAMLTAISLEIRPEWREAMPMVMNLVGDVALTADVTTAISVQLLLTPQKPELGQPLEDLLRGVLSAQVAQAQQAPDGPTPRSFIASELLRRIKVGREGDRVAVSFKVDPNEFAGAGAQAAPTTPAQVTP